MVYLDEVVMAMVKKIVSKPERGPPYAVAKAVGIKGSITFRLTPPVWCDDSPPEEGVAVRLTKLKKLERGWRAMSGRLWKPSDEIKQGQEPKQSAKPTRSK